MIKMVDKRIRRLRPIFRKIASDSDVNLYELIFEVSKINYLNPDKKTIQKIAEDLRRIEK